MPGRIARSVGVLECWSIGLGFVELYVLERKRRAILKVFVVGFFPLLHYSRKRLNYGYAT